MVGIKETNEMLDAVVELAKAGVAVAAIAKDGLDVSDLEKGFNLIKDQAGKIDVYAAGIKDAKLIAEEIKDLDKAELIAIIMKVVEGVSVVKAV